jgi:toxin ParE1/3/4
VESALSAIIEMPMAWPLYEDPTRRYLLRRFPYAIIYVVTDDALMVLAIAHTSRRPGYWRHRLGSEKG